MRNFLCGAALGAVAVAALAGGAAWSQAARLHPITNHFNGLLMGQTVQVTCINANGAANEGATLEVMRPPGRAGGPDVTLQCR